MQELQGPVVYTCIFLYTIHNGHITAIIYFFNSVTIVDHTHETQIKLFTDSCRLVVGPTIHLILFSLSQNITMH